MADDSLGSVRAELALLAARFALPGLGPDVDRAIRLACDLLVRGLDTPATAAVAALAYGTALRDAGPVIRGMLCEQDYPAPGPEAGEDEEFTTVLRAVAAGGMGTGEFFTFFMRVVPAREQQDAVRRRLMVLLSAWLEETTPEGRSAMAVAVRSAARDAVGDPG